MKRGGVYAACQEIDSYPHLQSHKKSKGYFTLSLRLLKLLKPSGYIHPGSVRLKQKCAV